MPKVFALIIIHYLIISSALATDPYPRNYSIDVQHYRFTIELNDSTNLIDANAEVTILVKKPLSELALDLSEISESGGGMVVRSVHYMNNSMKHTHENGRLMINFNAVIKADELITLKIYYAGQPLDGLIIGANKFGDRTFFGDNWPDRAHNWLPIIDHPYDKASCEFIIIAPDHYQAIANGIIIEKTNLPKNRILTHWIENADIPTKVMVIGVARFATTTAGIVDGIPIETWVYPQDMTVGFSDFSASVDIMKYLTHVIGPYPYQKLANVQSTTRYGGMENASNIFYFENLVTGKNKLEATIAHEISHQWFGDSASELDWHHVWLSEGFATYFTNLYYEHTYGRSALVERMKKQSEEVIHYYKRNPSPVIDTTISDIRRVLTTNVYQKGSWVLHMLRREVGDEIFWKGIQAYYRIYQNGNALTGDFMQIMEDVSGRDLKIFFDQWLWKSGHPIIIGSWTYDAKNKLINLKIKQNQTALFSTPLDIGFLGSDGIIEKQTVLLVEKEAEYALSVREKPKELVLDPDTWLLFEGKIMPK